MKAIFNLNWPRKISVLGIYEETKNQTIHIKLNKCKINK